MDTTTRRRQATPERWQKALGRAVAEGVQVRQLSNSGAWLATSGTDATKAYELEVVAGIVVSCACPAGEFGDPCCKHAAAFYRLADLLDPEPPTPAAPSVRVVPRHCPACAGDGFVRKVSALFGTGYRVDCRACRGSGLAGKEAPAPLAA